MRDYVAAAKEYLISLGGEYKPSVLEKKAAIFNSNMEYILSITVQYGGSFGGSERKTLIRDGDRILVERMSSKTKEQDGPLCEERSYEFTFLHTHG